MNFITVDSARMISCHVSMLATNRAVTVTASSTGQVVAVAAGQRDQSSEINASAA